MGRAKRVLFYVQHLLGIGHLMRVKRIVSALRDHGFEIALVTGGAPLPGFDVHGIEHIVLPSIAVSSADFKTLVDAQGQPIDDAFKMRRRNALLGGYHAFGPDVVILEAFPFGRRQVRFELLPLIDAIEASTPRPLLLASIRDILQKRIKPGRDRETARLVLAHFDQVLVHGDPDFATLEESFTFTAQIADRISYTGLVSSPPPEPADELFDVVVSAGGGAVGANLVQCAIEAARELPDTGAWCVITGPNLPQKQFEQIASSAPQHVTVERFRPDFTALLVNTQLSVSQAGYNTVSDVLQARCRCLLVPFSMGSETEQLSRAQRLHELGLVTVLSEDKLCRQHLLAAIKVALSKKAPSSPVTINVDGANQTARILKNLLN